MGESACHFVEYTLISFAECMKFSVGEVPQSDRED